MSSESTLYTMAKEWVLDLVAREPGQHTAQEVIDMGVAATEYGPATLQIAVRSLRVDTKQVRIFYDDHKLWPADRQHSGKGGDWEAHEPIRLPSGVGAWPPKTIVLFLLDMVEKKNYDPNSHLHAEVVKHARKAIDGET